MSIMRLISNSRSGIKDMTAKELKAAIKGSEGRVVMSQLNPRRSVLNDVTNPELAQAMGADMIMVNGYSMDPDELFVAPNDVAPARSNWLVQEYKGKKEGWINKTVRLKELKDIIDIPIGIYLETSNQEVFSNQEVTTYGWKEVPKGRMACKKNYALLKQEGADFVVLAGNPGSGVTYENIIQATKECKEIVKDDVLIFAGKWEDGNSEPILGDPQLGMEKSKKIIQKLIDAGADCITLAMPGARYGISTEDIKELVTFIHTYKPGTLALSFLDGSVEGSDIETIRICTIESKKTGADIHAIGDAGLNGMSVPENIYQMAITTKGRRLTWKRMAGSKR